jgi:hypothetical protein
VGEVTTVRARGGVSWWLLRSKLDVSVSVPWSSSPVEKGGGVIGQGWVGFEVGIGWGVV